MAKKSAAETGGASKTIRRVTGKTNPMMRDVMIFFMIVFPFSIESNKSLLTRGLLASVMMSRFEV
jgi:hypothetical protein